MQAIHSYSLDINIPIQDFRRCEFPLRVLKTQGTDRARRSRASKTRSSTTGLVGCRVSRSWVPLVVGVVAKEIFLCHAFIGVDGAHLLRDGHSVTLAVEAETQPRERAHRALMLVLRSRLRRSDPLALLREFFALVGLAFLPVETGRVVARRDHGLHGVMKVADKIEKMLACVE